jgi:hypothetical protein
VKGWVLGLLLGAVAGCAAPPPPRDEAKRLYACGDMEAQPAQVAENERPFRVEVSNKASSNYQLSGICMNHRKRHIAPLENVPLDELGERPLVFEVHALKTAKRIKFHFHATVHRRAGAAATGWDKQTNLDLDIPLGDIPESGIKLTIDVTDDHKLITQSEPPSRPPEAPASPP